jgi:transcriptional regulator with XRE-family HTH domain
MTEATRKRPKDPLDHEPKAVSYAREQSGLTQRQVADLCGVTRSLIAEIELGTRNATPAMIGKLAAALNCPRVVLERKRADVAPNEPEAAPAADGPVLELRDAERPAGEAEEVQELRSRSVGSA